eukprot:9098457-Pyramimonas_sp.AAC.1
MTLQHQPDLDPMTPRNNDDHIADSVYLFTSDQQYTEQPDSIAYFTQAQIDQGYISAVSIQLPTITWQDDPHDPESTAAYHCRTQRWPWGRPDLQPRWATTIERHNQTLRALIKTMDICYNNNIACSVIRPPNNARHGDSLIDSIPEFNLVIERMGSGLLQRRQSVDQGSVRNMDPSTSTGTPPRPRST